MRIFRPRPITKKDFTLFGEVISPEGISPLLINNGFSKRYNQVMIPDFGKEGETLISIFSAKKRRFPMTVDMMEKHPLGSQAFIPLKETTFLCFIAPQGEKPDLDRAESFIIPPGLGINLKPGIWHFPLISTEDMNFIVIDRSGPGDNLVTKDLRGLEIVLEYGASLEN